MEAERPSASYVVDVRCSPLGRMDSATDLSLDGTPLGSNPLACGHDPRSTSTSINWKVKKAHYCCEMDTGG